MLALRKLGEPTPSLRPEGPSEHGIIHFLALNLAMATDRIGTPGSEIVAQQCSWERLPDTTVLSACNVQQQPVWTFILQATLSFVTATSHIPSLTQHALFPFMSQNPLSQHSVRLSRLFPILHSRAHPRLATDHGGRKPLWVVPRRVAACAARAPRGAVFVALHGKSLTARQQSCQWLP